MSRVRTISLIAYATIAAVAPVRGTAGQPPAIVDQPRALGPLTALSAEEQTRLALSTAPPEVSSRASLYVLTPTGYTQARVGTNGFSCLVEREFLETVEPVCYDAEGSATTLLARLYREELRAEGLPEDEVKQRVAAAYRDGRLRAPRKPGIVYMLAPEQRSRNPVTGQVWQAPPHYMFYAPFATQEDLGGGPGRPGIPLVVWPGQPDALIIVRARGSDRR